MNADTGCPRTMDISPPDTDFQQIMDIPPPDTQQTMDIPPLDTAFHRTTDVPPPDTDQFSTEPDSTPADTLNSSRSASMDSRGASMDLLRAAQNGDRDACERLLLENNGLIWSVAQRYQGRGVESDDLYQLGCLGFLKAVQGFDFSYGTCFSTYAVPKISGEIRRFLRDDGPLKVGRAIRERARVLYAVRERLRQTYGREPALSELSDELGISAEEVAQIELATGIPESLQQENADGLPLEGMLGTVTPEDGMIEHLTLRDAIEQLPEKERLTILLRYFRGLTQEQCARILHVSQVQISRLERRGLSHLRQSFRDG